MQTQDYLNLVTSEHNQKPKYMAMIAVDVQGYVDNQALCATFPALFDLDLAVGQQLEFLGAWVGLSRNGFDDTTYRTFLKLKIALNHWDGNVPGIYSIWNTVFSGAVQVLVQDNQDMTMFIVFVLQPFTPTEIALINTGQFDLRPAGVGMLGHFKPSVAGFPVFGLGVENSSISGLGVGYIVAPLA